MHNKNKDNDNVENVHCICTNTYGLFLPNKQLSLVLSFLLLCALCIFIAGYFLGKKQVVEERNSTLQEEFFADSIYAQVLINNEKQQGNEISKELLVEKRENSENVESSEQAYYAPLIGFGYEHNAQGFKQKLAKKNIAVLVNTMQSKNVRGVTKNWYQVTTNNYKDKEELQLLVDRISKEEKLNGVKILTRQ